LTQWKFWAWGESSERIVWVKSGYPRRTGLIDAVNESQSVTVILVNVLHDQLISSQVLKDVAWFGSTPWFFFVTHAIFNSSSLKWKERRSTPRYHASAWNTPKRMKNALPASMQASASITWENAR
jgi:hypothetical protein